MEALAPLLEGIQRPYCITSLGRDATAMRATLQQLNNHRLDFGEDSIETHPPIIWAIGSGVANRCCVINTCAAVTTWCDEVTPPNADPLQNPGLDTLHPDDVDSVSHEKVDALVVALEGGGEVSVARCLTISVTMATVLVSVPALGPAASMMCVDMMLTGFLKRWDMEIRISEASDKQDTDGTTTTTPTREVTGPVTHLIRS